MVGYELVSTTSKYKTFTYFTKKIAFSDLNIIQDIKRSRSFKKWHAIKKELEMYNPNDKFFIIDEKNKIIASSNNMLELRIQCHNINSRIGGNCKNLNLKIYN